MDSPPKPRKNALAARMRPADATEEPGGRRRVLFALSVMLLVVLLQQLAIFITNRDLHRFGSVLLWFGLELPTLLFALSRLFGWARSQELRWGVFVAAGMLLSALLGSVSGALFYAAIETWPELGLKVFSSAPPATLSRVMLFGLTQAQTHFGLWTLGYALPTMLENARVRELEAQKLAAESQQLRSAAELARLRGHLEPHFLLNTLNAIAGLVTEDPRQARRKKSLVFLQPAEIWAFEADERLTFVHTRHGRFDVDLSLAAIELSMGAQLTRVHRKWLVNVAHVRELMRGDNETVLFVGEGLHGDGPGVEVPVSRDRVVAVREALLRSAVGTRQRS